MSYVRAKKVPGKDGKVYTYYQLVEGKRVDGKVRQRVIAHLGRHDSKEAAQEAAAAYVVPDYLSRLKKINAEYLDHFLASRRREAEGIDAYWELRSLGGQRSRSATARRRELKKLLAERQVDHDKAEAVRIRAGEIFDALSPTEQERARQQAPGVINHLESSRRSRAGLSERLGASF